MPMTYLRRSMKSWIQHSNWWVVQQQIFMSSEEINPPNNVRRELGWEKHPSLCKTDCQGKFIAPWINNKIFMREQVITQLWAGDALDLSVAGLKSSTCMYVFEKKNFKNQLTLIAWNHIEHFNSSSVSHLKLDMHVIWLGKILLPNDTSVQ